MSAKCIALFKYGSSRQRGAALLIMLVILVIGAAILLVSSLNSSALQARRDKTTADALAQAKEALIGRAVADTNLPGSLPCPDTNDDGSAELLSGNACPSYIGRLPWRTLGLTDLRDGSGERLWYALSPAFRDDNSAQPLNSNTMGTLPVYNADGVTLQTETGYNAVAVIFAPGSPIGSQTRNTVAQQTDAANYLDTANGKNNYAAGPFIAGAKSDTFNDQLIYITTKNLIPLIEQRVAGVVKQALADYYTASSLTPANRYYPWADSLGGAPNYDANDGVNRGWLPQSASTTGGAVDWVSGSPPTWFFSNEWYKLIYYSVANNYSQNHNPGTLTLDTTTGVRVLFFMPGTPIPANIAPATVRTTDVVLSEYLEDPENNDNANDVYVTPTSQAFDRDRLYWLSSSSIWKP